MATKQLPEQIGCGYCIHEKTCTMRDPKINKAKLGCTEYQHFNSPTIKIKNNGK